MNFTTYPSRTTLSKLAVAITTATITSVAMAHSSIHQVSVDQASEQLTELNVDFVSDAVQPTAYQLNNPNRLVLDFPSVDNQVANRVQNFNQGHVKNVTTVSNGNTTRMVIDLTDEATFSTRVDNDRLVVSIQSVQGKMVEAPTVQPVTATTQPVQPPVKTMMVKVNPLLDPTVATSRQYNYNGLNGINIDGSSNGGANININLVNDGIPVDVQRMGDELIVRLTGATIPNHLLKQMSGTGLVGNITTNNQGRNGVIRIAMTDDYEYKAYQMGNQLTINVESPKKLREPTLEERTYTGAPISLEFQDVPVRQILDVLGQHTNTNIIASDTVTGNITLRLIEVPWDQALDIILKSKNLDKRVNGNVTWVAPTTELVAQEAAELEAIQKSDGLVPLRTEYIRLNYAKAADLRAMIEAGRSTANSRVDSGSLLSGRGTVTIDSRTNTLIIKDTSASITNIRDLISKVDIPVKQVMIEARIVNATDSFSKEMGVKWGILSQGVANNRKLLVGATDQTLWDLKKPSIDSKTGAPTYSITRGDNLNVNLGANNPAGRIAFGLLSISDLLLDLELSAMQSDGRGEIISSPKVLTTDKQKAKVMSGQQIAYQEAAASGATSTSWIEAALSLEVTPNITPEGRIGMELLVENGSPIQAPDGSIAIAKDSVQTNVVVDDGQTVVLGGVFKNTIRNSVEKVPFLGDLPYVNRLFRRTVKGNEKQELLIFVTPKLVNDGVSRIN
ncbi:type II and III secretion system protein [Moraxella macacae 0408225]|uniref:Type II and III secretion system protein n=1 Tax=Moraxella macacae 0408225 TaxID=1230338 RepID=L2FAF2_9GAMM|nr:type IV pilus secretin family protein [Moraxella macacae]ELA09443.1 type II and III secretion system protein [Moraxella macacae 0408225]